MKNDNKKEDVVPENIIGKMADLEHSVEEASIDEADVCFKRAEKRLLNPAIWHELAGVGSGKFMLAKKNPEEKNRLIIAGDYLMIDIPGPGPVAGNGYDWVRVEKIVENFDREADNSFALTLRASENPQLLSSETAHFFKSEATSTLVVIRSGSIVTASYHGRNELPNTKGVNIKDWLRNKVVAAGALYFYSDLQWMGLLKGLLNKEIGK